MKKIFFTILLLLSPNFVKASDFDLNIHEYLGKSYIGMPYEQAIEQKIPFLLIFANPNDITSIIKLLSLGKMVYDEFKGQYNFCILSTKARENKHLIKEFDVKKKPALFIIDTQNQTYTYVERKYYKQRKLREILTEFNS